MATTDSSPESGTDPTRTRPGDLRDQKELVALGLNELPASSIVIFDQDQRFVLVRGGAVLDNGFAPADFEGRLASESLAPERYAGYRPMYEAALAGQTVQREVISPDGTRTYALTCSPVLDSGGRVLGGVLSATEITRLRASQKREAESAARFKLAMESAPIGMATLSMDRTFLEVNDALCQMLGRSRAALIGHSLTAVIHPLDNDADLAVRAKVLHGSERWAKTEKRLIRGDGSEIWVNHSVGVVDGENGEPVSYVSQFADITEARAKQSRLQILADSDRLTGLPNRGALQQTLDTVFPATAEQPVTIVFIDVDDFKRLNDVYGHQVGDQSLIEVAHRLQARVRDDDLLARFGGDEFVLLTRTPPSALPELCSRLIASLRDPLHLQDVTVEATLSIGAACSRPGDDYESVLGRADEGLYEAKGSGGDTFVIAGS